MKLTRIAGMKIASVCVPQIIADWEGRIAYSGFKTGFWPPATCGTIFTSAHELIPQYLRDFDRGANLPTYGSSATSEESTSQCLALLNSGRSTAKSIQNIFRKRLAHHPTCANFCISGR